MFLYGMVMLGNGLEKISGGKLEATLEKMTSNTWKAILVGALVTAAIQSSSATTVIVVGLVNAKLLNLKQSIGIIMGANIGTTVTAWILSLSELNPNIFYLSFLKPTSFTPILLVVGLVLTLASRKSVRRNAGMTLIGFGILFMGMFGMEDSVSRLKDMPAITGLFVKFTNPFLGVLVGLVVTAIIQSSSASIGILQALSTTGIIPFAAAFPVILGQNIGTCITPVIASFGASRNAKRSAAIHVSFNVIGTVVFLCAIYAWQHFVGFSFWNSPVDKVDIAIFHTTYKIAVTLMLAPLSVQLEKLSKVLIRERDTEDVQNEEYDEATLALDERFYISPNMSIAHAREAIHVMANMARQNFKQSFSLLLNFDRKLYDNVRETEDAIDRIQSKVESYLLKVTEKTLTETESLALSEVLQVTNEFERIGDRADGICDCAMTMQDRDITFSEKAIGELKVIFQAIEEILDIAIEGYESNNTQIAFNVEPLDEVINLLVETLKQNHIERLKQGKCTIEAAFPFIEVLGHMERISVYCSNVGVHLHSYHTGGKDLDRHEYLRQMRRDRDETYTEYLNAYDKKYFDQIVELEQSV